MSESLFNNFKAVCSKQWKNQIQYELKGENYNDTLVWETPEGIKVKPFYTPDQIKEPLVITTQSECFKIVQNIFVHDLKKSIAKAQNTIQRGAESLRFTIDTPEIDIEKLLNSLPNTVNTVYINLLFFNLSYIQLTEKTAKSKNFTLHILLDPIGQLTKQGNWFFNLQTDFEILKTIASSNTDFAYLNINSAIYQNAGANMVQQIAYTLAHVNEYFNRIPSIKSPITIEVAVGSNYFFEIAKLRALRILFNILAQEYQHPFDCHILASPTKRNKTIYDYNVNMLRTTTECMSAILGQANAIANLPYDAIYHKDNEFGERIARNQLLILKNESHFDKVNNPANGAYYIEELTQQLAEKALDLFKNIEANGGFITQLIEGTIQRKITQSAQKEQELFDTNKEILLGTNKYINKQDSMQDELELFPFVKTKPRKTLITPIIEKRLAEPLEQERLEAEKNK